MKVHQLNSSWSEAKKVNFVKHALREYRIHRQGPDHMQAHVSSKSGPLCTKPPIVLDTYLIRYLISCVVSSYALGLQHILGRLHGCQFVCLHIPGLQDRPCRSQLLASRAYLHAYLSVTPYIRHPKASLTAPQELTRKSIGSFLSQGSDIY